MDSVGYITADDNVSSNVDLTELQEIITTMDGLKESDYDSDSWTAYQNALNEASGSRWTLELAQSIAADPVTYGADQETVNEITGHYQKLLDILISSDAPVEISSKDGIPQMLAVPVNGTAADITGGTLPSTVPVKNVNGTTNESAEITWKLSGDTSAAYNTAAVIGAAKS